VPIEVTNKSTAKDSTTNVCPTRLLQKNENIDAQSLPR